ncbi:MAG: NAD(P)-dependent oxidoreductase [Candidatus Omnitrophica bacterium]|nr:NAD(P)-dependent oxidoreductase [Candidatus Omnitrophota bacterium]
MATYLISGHESGLGKHLKECFGGRGLGRNTPLEEMGRLRQEGVDIIIHCAARRPQAVKSDALFPFIDDNIFLTDRMIQIPHKKFICISSIGVYPKTVDPHHEEEDIPLEKAPDFYAVCKLISEALVKQKCRNYLILRCAALLGVHARPNSLIKIAEEDRPTLTLSADSVMNYIRHSQVADFIKFSVGSNLQGIYNVCSRENISLLKVAEMLRKKVNFGTFRYSTGNMVNRKISSVFPVFKQTSEEMIDQFLREDLPKRKSQQQKVKTS